MQTHIKYNELSADIRREIDEYYSRCILSNPEHTIEQAMSEWFDQSFDVWLNQKYCQSGSKNRKHFRFNIEIPVKVVERLIDSDSTESEEMDYVGTILNISRGGFYFRSREVFSISSIIKVIVDLSSIDKSLDNLEALAMVVRFDKSGDDTYGVGVMFSSIYNEDRQNLDVFIFKNVAYHISSGL